MAEKPSSTFESARALRVLNGKPRSPIVELLENLHEAGVADYVKAVAGDEILHEYGRGWRIYESPIWKLDHTGGIQRRVERALREMIPAAANLDSRDVRKVATIATRMLAQRKIESVVKLLEHKLPATREEFDRDPELLAVPNGVVSLRTGELRAASSKDALTRCAAIDYDPDAPAPVFEGFVKQILPDDEVRRFVHEAFGYSATAYTTEQCFFMCYGGGANGKSTLLNIVEAALGDYATTCEFDTFLATNHERPSHEIAALEGFRFVQASEPEEGRRFAAARMKALTGGDTIRARRLYHESETIRPSWKLWQVMNHLPRVQDDSLGFWRRARTIPFTVTIPPADRDPRLNERLAQELPGILAWVVAGAVAWHQNGRRLDVPRPVLAATRAYREREDILADWFRDRCDLGTEYTETAAALYADFSAHQHANGERVPSAKTFGDALDRHGIASRRGTGGTRFRDGIRLRSSANGGPLAPESDE